LIHRHIERTIKLETRVGEFEVARGLTRFSATGDRRDDGPGIPIFLLPVHILPCEELEHRSRESKPRGDRAPAEATTDSQGGRGGIGGDGPSIAAGLIRGRD